MHDPPPTFRMSRSNSMTACIFNRNNRGRELCGSPRLQRRFSIRWHVGYDGAASASFKVKEEPSVAQSGMVCWQKWPLQIVYCLSSWVCPVVGMETNLQLFFFFSEFFFFLSFSPSASEMQAGWKRRWWAHCWVGVHAFHGCNLLEGVGVRNCLNVAIAVDLITDSIREQITKKAARGLAV